MSELETPAAEQPQEEPPIPTPTRTRERPKMKTRDELNGKAQATRVSDALAPAPTLVTLGGREFRVGRLTFNDLLFAETVGLDLNEILAGLGALRLTAVRDFVWFMLRKSDPALTVEETGELMPPTLAELAELLEQLLAASGLNQGGGSGPGNVASSPTGE